MHDLPSNNPSQPHLTCSQAPEALRTIGRGILSSLDQSGRIYGESPPEAILGALLRFTTGAGVDDADPIEVLARERVCLGEHDSVSVELDLLLRRTGTGAAAVIEVEGWRWHRRSPEEHDQEVRRDRLVRQHYPCAIRYAATEVLQDPWGVVLDVYAQMQTWPTWADVTLLPELRAIAEACALPARTAVLGAANAAAGPPPRSVLEHVRQVAATLPLPPHDPALTQVRQEYPRMYANWADAEAAALRDAFRAAVDIEDIALALGRTEPAVWAQLRRMRLVAS